MAPTVAPGAQVRRSAAAVRGEGGGHLSYLQTHEAGFDHHFAGKLHAGSAQAQCFVTGFAEAAQPAVILTALAMEKQPSHERQHRILQITVHERHGAGLNAPGKTVAHYQRMTGAQLRQETRYMPEVIAVIGVTHDQITATSSADAPREGVATSLLLHVDNTRTHG